MFLLRRIQEYRNSYRNFISVIIEMRKLNKSIHVILKDGTSHTWTFHQAFQYSFLHRILRKVI